jgi:hypothetical protein
VPAAAVIPAPIAYIKVVAVKKLVVGSRDAHLFKHPCHRVKLVTAWCCGLGPLIIPQGWLVC